MTDIIRPTTASGNGDITLPNRTYYSHLQTFPAPPREHYPFSAEIVTSQVDGPFVHSKRPSQLPAGPRVCVIDGAVSLREELVDRLRSVNISVVSAGSAEQVLRVLVISPREWDVILYPIWTNWQRALDFARNLRRLREGFGLLQGPKALILSFTEQLPITSYQFVRVGETRYLRYSSETDLVRVLRAIQNEMLEAGRKSQRLHLRFVHSGNKNAIGCIPEERLVAVYASFQPGMEDQLDEAESLLRFLNLLAGYRLSKSAQELVSLMRRSPFYISDGPRANVPDIRSIKTYISRSETLLLRSWHRKCRTGQPPMVITREPRGGREVGYKLLATSEVDHI